MKVILLKVNYFIRVPKYRIKLIKVLYIIKDVIMIKANYN